MRKLLQFLNYTEHAFHYTTRTRDTFHDKAQTYNISADKI